MTPMTQQGTVTQRSYVPTGWFPDPIDPSRARRWTGWAWSDEVRLDQPQMRGQVLGAPFGLLAKVVQVALLVSGVLAGVTVAVNLWQLDQLATWRASSPSLDGVDEFALTQWLLSSAGNALYALTGMLFVGWFFWAYGSDRVRPLPYHYDQAWAFVAWFIPVLNLVRPYQMARGMLGLSQGPTPVSLWRPWWLNAWWVTFWTWNATVTYTRFAASAGHGPSVAEEFVAREHVLSAGVVSGVLGVVAAALAIVVVRQITQAVRAAITTVPLPAAAPRT